MREVNINIEGYNVNGICVGCLNYGRKMSYDRDIEKCFKLIANIDISDGLSVQVCWECLASVRSVLKFQSTLIESYDVLIGYSKQHTFLNSPSDLAIYAKQRFTVSQQTETDIVTIKTEDTDSLTEVTEIKKEIDEEKVDFDSNEPSPPQSSKILTYSTSTSKKDVKKIHGQQNTEQESMLRIEEQTPELSTAAVGTRSEQNSSTYEHGEYDIDTISYNDYSIDSKSASDEDIQLSKLKEQKKRKSRLKKKSKKVKNVKKEIFFEKEDTYKLDKLMKKLKNLPDESVELLEVNEQEMWDLRKEDLYNDDFTKLKYKCEKCILSFNSEKLLMDHFSGKHSRKNPQAIQCDICQVYILTKESFKQHRNNHLSVYSCKKCLYRTSSKKLIKSHLVKEHGAEEVSCKSCGENFGTKSKLSYHKNVCKQEKPQCDCCGKVFANKITLKYHLKVLPVSKSEGKDEKPVQKLMLKCHGCGKIFRTRKSYRAHVVIHDGLQYPCSICGKQFQWKRNLARHMRNHRDKEAGALHECRQCGKRFSSRDCYNNHMRFSKKHVAEDKLTHECSYCGKKFATKWCMVDHIDWDHLKNIKYQCNTCLKPFKTAKILVAHINNIHGTKSKEPDGQHLCDICGKYYKSVKRLKGHVSAMHTHRSTTKSYKCHFCPATFTWQTSIYKHLKMMHEWPRKDTRNKRIPVDMQPKKEPQYPDMQPTMQFYPQIVNISNSQISISLPSNI